MMFYGLARDMRRIDTYKVENSGLARILFQLFLGAVVTQSIAAYSDESAAESEHGSVAAESSVAPSDTAEDVTPALDPLSFEAFDAAARAGAKPLSRALTQDEIESMKISKWGVIEDGEQPDNQRSLSVGELPSTSTEAD